MKIALSGYFGRMGQEIVSCANDKIGFGIIREGDDRKGEQLNDKNREGRHQLISVKELRADAVSVIIDFSSPSGSEKVLSFAQKEKIPILIGTTGFSKPEIEKIIEVSNEIPIVLAPNTSVGINILLEAVNLVAGAIPNSWDVELVELHHKNKKDAPSGTALSILQEVLDYRVAKVVSGRESLRAPDEIGAFGVRGGNIVGEHTLYFIGEGERIELTHRAHDRKIFAQGALMAAEWLISSNRKPGIYSMRDVLFGDRKS